MSGKKLVSILLAVLLAAAVIPGLAEDTEVEISEVETVVEQDTATEESSAPEAAEGSEAEAAAEDSNVTETAAEVMTQAATMDAASVDELQAILSDSQRLDAAYTLALNAIQAEDYETAKEYINICFAYCDAQSNPVVFSDLLLKRGCIDVIEEKYDMALLNLDAALRVQPDLADAWLVKTQIYASQGEAAQAADSLEQYIALTGDTSLYDTVAQLRELMGDVAGAQEAYTKYAEGAGASAEEVGFQNGVYLMEAGKYDEAIAAFEAYTDNETFGAGAQYNIGVCKMNQGNYAEAVAAFQACEEKGGTYEGLYYNRGVCSLLSWSCF